MGLALDRTVKSLVLAVDEHEPVKDGDDAPRAARVVATRIYMLVRKGLLTLIFICIFSILVLIGFSYSLTSSILMAKHTKSQPITAMLKLTTIPMYGSGTTNQRLLKTLK